MATLVDDRDGSRTHKRAGTAYVTTLENMDRARPSSVMAGSLERAAAKQGDVENRLREEILRLSSPR